jgi:hypothetical protein
MIFLVFLLIPSQSLTPIWRVSISIGVVALLAAAVLVMPLLHDALDATFESEVLELALRKEGRLS